MNFIVEIQSKGFIELLAFPVEKSIFTDKKEDAFLFHSREYIKEKLRGTSFDGNYEIMEIE